MVKERGAERAKGRKKEARQDRRVATEAIRVEEGVQRRGVVIGVRRRGSAAVASK